MRTADEIISKIHAVASDDWLGVIAGDLLAHLDYENAKPFLRENMTEDEFKAAIGGVQDPRDAMRDYLEFAWGKANGCRGISASRSMDHIHAWLWLMGVSDETIAGFMSGYCFYGKPQLAVVSELVGFDWRSLDNGDWVNSESDDPLTSAEREKVFRRTESMWLEKLSLEAA